jgi:LPS-assembly lipoprotein
MWSLEPGSHGRRPATRRLIRGGAAVLLAALAAGCFQPMYGERSFNGSPGLRSALASVDVAQIDGPPGTPVARLGVEVRNELTYALTNGASALPPTHRLDVILRPPSSNSLIVDPSTARTEFDIVVLDATYKLVDLRSAKQVMDGTATVRTSFDVPGQQQRYAMLRGQRDAQSRAAKVIAEQIRNRLASYFTAGS